MLMRLWTIQRDHLRQLTLSSKKLIIMKMALFKIISTITTAHKIGPFQNTRSGETMFCSKLWFDSWLFLNFLFLKKLLMVMRFWAIQCVPLRPLTLSSKKPIMITMPLLNLGRFHTALTYNQDKNTLSKLKD